MSIEDERDPSRIIRLRGRLSQDCGLGAVSVENGAVGGSVGSRCSVRD